MFLFTKHLFRYSTVVKWTFIYYTFQFHSPPTQSKASQPKTQAATTQEELTEEDRLETDGSAVSNGQLHSVLPIIKIPSSDVYGHYPPVEPEPLGQKKTGLQRYEVALLVCSF